MIAIVNKLFGTKKTILLDVPDSFPDWHSHYGEDTGFEGKIRNNIPTKIHAIKLNVKFWKDAYLKYLTGFYRVKIVYFEDPCDYMDYYLIKRCNNLHLQEAYFDETQSCLVVEGRYIAIDTVAKNEGYAVDDFMKFMKRIGQKKFCIVHFTKFRY